MVGWNYLSWRDSTRNTTIIPITLKKGLPESMTSGLYRKLQGTFCEFRTDRFKSMAELGRVLFFMVDVTRRLFGGGLPSPSTKWVKINLFLLSCRCSACLPYFSYLGWQGVLFIILIPWMFFYFWLSTFIYLHHYHPEKRFMKDGEWTR